MKKVKGFNYDTETDKDVIEHIEKQGNQSNYIWNLVRKDMKETNLEEIIKRQVDKYLEETAKSIKNSPIG